MGTHDFSPRIPEIDSSRFSSLISFEAIVAIHGKLEKFQNIWIKKAFNNSRNVFNYAEKLLTGINAKINEKTFKKIFLNKFPTLFPTVVLTSDQRWANLVF